MVSKGIFTPNPWPWFLKVCLWLVTGKAVFIKMYHRKLVLTFCGMQWYFFQSHGFMANPHRQLPNSNPTKVPCAASPRSLRPQPAGRSDPVTPPRGQRPVSVVLGKKKRARWSNQLWWGPDSVRQTFSWTFGMRIQFHGNLREILVS